MKPEQLIDATFSRMHLSYDDHRSLLLQCLIDLMHDHQTITESDCRALQNKLGVSEIEIQQLVSFYSFLQNGHAVDFRIYVSDNIIDQMNGSEPLYRQLHEQLDLDKHTSEEESSRCSVKLRKTSCIGLSDQGPALLINGYLLPKVDHQRCREICRKIKQRIPPTEWPADWFSLQNNIRHSGSLLDLKINPGDSLQACLSTSATDAIKILADSGLRGRGGAGFSTATKWQFCRQSPATSRVIVCNADEGEPGTFKDRVLLSEKPELLIDGMLIAAHLCEADKGFIYLRGEYRCLLEPLQKKLHNYRQLGLLGKGINNLKGFNFDIDIHLGAGAYICGEESALIESLEGKAGIPRNRPPYPVNSGYMGLPTVVNNVETLANISLLFSPEKATFSQQGTSASHGSKLLSISGDCLHPGIYEVPLGSRVQDVLDLCGARDTQAVQIGGAAGRLLATGDLSRQICFEDISTAGAVMIFNRQRSVLDIACNFAAFFVHESCGFCTPCRVGTQVQLKILQRLQKQVAGALDLQNLQSLCEVMQSTSHCGLGASASWISQSLLDNFSEQLGGQPPTDKPAPVFDLEAALQPARQLAGHS